MTSKWWSATLASGGLGLIYEAAMHADTATIVPMELTEHRQRFAFVANPRPLFRGTVGAVVILSIGFVWAWWSGRIKNVDAGYIGMVVAIVAVVPPLMYWLQLRGTRRSAASLGHVEVDDAGVRWQRPDGSIGFNVLWVDVSSATVDARNFTIVLFRRDGGPASIVGALSQHGVPSGAVVLERFDEIVELVSLKVQASPFKESVDPSAAKVNAHLQQAARRTLWLGLGGCLTAVAVYAANMALAARLNWTRWLLPMPLVIGGFSLLALVAAVRLRRGNAPLLSPIYLPSYRTTVVRFFVVASLANFILMAIANTIYR